MNPTELLTVTAEDELAEARVKLARLEQEARRATIVLDGVRDYLVGSKGEKPYDLHYTIALELSALMSALQDAREVYAARRQMLVERA